MKGFIEVTSGVSGDKRLVNIERIQHVGDFSGDTVIIFNYILGKKKTEYDYINVAETYDEVVAKIKEATE